MNNKVLVISHFREPSGWGQAARNMLLSMHKAGIDTVARCISFTPMPDKLINPAILEMEQKSSYGCNICIQYVLPHLMDYDGNFDKNIGYFDAETDTWGSEGWLDRLRLMDEVWVVNNKMLRSTPNNYQGKVRIIPHAVDTRKYRQLYNPMYIKEAEDTFKFYFIGEVNRRKNITALLEAFHIEFHPNELVSLILKVNKPGGDGAPEMQNLCEKVKENLKLYPKTSDYKAEIIVPGYIDDRDISRLHQYCDCMVMPSFGEAFSYPCMDALGFGRPVICTANCGIDYVNNDNGTLVASTEESCTGMLNTFHDLNTAREHWSEISVKELGKAMRKIYEFPYLYRDKSIKATMTPSNFSLENIGRLINDSL
jgi:glycosyltransferase involved in cell wall biosynthesis